MQTKMSLAWPEASLARILEAFEREILEASEAEIMEAANELGMKPDMKGSAAFIDLIGLRGVDIRNMHSWSSALDERVASEDCEYPDGESPASRELKSLRQPKNSDNT